MPPRAPNGPVVATSATGAQLAMGPPGPKGDRGDQGPIGPAGPAGQGIGSVAPLRLNAHSGAALTVTQANVYGTIYLDSSTGAGGGFTVTLTGTWPDGGEIYFWDQTGNLAVNNVLITDSTPRNIEDPIAQGTWPSQTITLAQQGGKITLKYDATLNRWGTR